MRVYRMKNIGRRAAANVGLVVATLLLVFLAGETYCRFWRDTSDSYGATWATRHWFQRHFHRNQMGYRDSVEYSLTPPAGVRRLSFLGDSFTAAHGVNRVEDRFANRIGAALAPAWQVYAIAEVGWDTRDETDAMAALIAQGYRTDAIVLVYCLNDIPIDDSAWRRTVGPLFDHLARRPPVIGHSALLDTLDFRLQLLLNPGLRGYYDFVRDAYDGPALDVERASMVRLRDLATSHGIELAAVTFPFLHAIGPDYPFRRAHERLAAIWESLNVPHLDLLPAFEGRPARSLVVNAFDAHPNELAHALAATAIQQFLVERGMLTARIP
jgi:lysophospholipase L1-like esterase